MMETLAEERWMRRALDLAERGAGAVSPNPLVGCVIVGPDGDMLGEGWHGEYGGPHAEVWAVRDAEKKHGAERAAAALRDATLVVTLEPCSHWGKTPPCADLIVEKGIPRVVVGMEDPFPAVAGGGIERLRAHEVDVSVGVLEHECKRTNEAFMRHIATGRPLVTLKVAQSLDGAVATDSGDSRWVSGEAARALVHRWRATLDAVLVGSGTALADDPALTVRHVDGRQPVRVVLDREGSLPPTLKLFTDEHAAHTIVVVGEDVQPAYADALTERGGLVLPTSERQSLSRTRSVSHLDLDVLLDRLGAGLGAHRPMQSLLIEAGPGLATALVRADLVDRLALFIAPKLVGGQHWAGDLGVERMADARTFAEHRWEPVGDDLLFFGYRRAV